MNLTPFQRKVYKVVSEIPLGEVRSYKWVAERIGSPGAARAVGEALNRNPYPLIIPCHRVVRSDGSIGGYRLGVEMKKKLLDLERRLVSGVHPPSLKLRGIGLRSLGEGGHL